MLRFIIAIICTCMLPAAAGSAGTTRIKVNQYVVAPTAVKFAVVPEISSDSFSLINIHHKDVVYRGRLLPPKFWSASGERVQLADFSEFSIPGEYRVVCDDTCTSAQFAIGTGRQDALVRSALKAFYFNRCSTRLPKRFAGVYARGAGHPDTSVVIHPSAADSLRPAGSILSSPGGWYDAGDYNKYSVNSAVAISLLLSAYEMYPEYFAALRNDIPESQNAIPDILDEVLWNLRWLVTMQDPNDGGVYHKLTTAEFSGMVMPRQDKAPRYVVYKSTAAALDFAAVCAQASRVFRNFSSALPGLADSCRSAAVRAWDWAKRNPSRYYFNRLCVNPEIKTGEYTDTNVSDEYMWAATELYMLTGDTLYRKASFPESDLPSTGRIPTWRDVGILPLFSVVLSSDGTFSTLRDSAATVILSVADSLLALQNRNPYRVTAGEGDFFWGSNSHFTTMGIIFLFAERLTREARYRNAAVNQIDYLLGRNPTGYSFVTGFGSRPSVNIHHRVSDADTVDDPVPGFLVGGANAKQQDRKHCDCYSSKLPALSYVDSTCSYASNEVAINWNAPFVFLAGGVAVFSRDMDSESPKSKAVKTLR